MFNNDFEKKVYDEILVPIVDKKWWFNKNDPFWHYDDVTRNLDRNKLWLFVDAPKIYGEMTNTEMVLIKNKSARIDCKEQTQKSSLTIGNIMYEIYTNTILHKLHEDFLIFVVHGNGIDWNVLNSFRKTLPSYIKILTFGEFKEFANNFN